MAADATSDRCPECGGDARPILYGLVESIEDLGDVALGGCIIYADESPAWECRSCGSRWGIAEEARTRRSRRHNSSTPGSSTVSWQTEKGRRVSDPYHLQRFVDAQDRSEIYLDALHELRSGLKQRHWMWFVFPQIAGLGRTPTALQFEIAGLDEARAYLAHPVLGHRLVECARILTELAQTDPVEIFGATDAMKLRSSMTLFARAAAHAQGQVFRDVLAQYYAGEEDPLTISRL